MGFPFPIYRLGVPQPSVNRFELDSNGLEIDSVKHIVENNHMLVDVNNLIAPITAAKLSGTTRQNINSRIKSGRVPAVWIDGHPFVLKAELIELYKSQPVSEKPPETFGKLN